LCGGKKRQMCSLRVGHAIASRKSSLGKKRERKKRVGIALCRRAPLIGWGKEGARDGKRQIKGRN